MSSSVGTLLSGRYRLDARIGSGGQSSVFRAFDTTLERQVAVKLLHHDVAADADALERFRREARAVAQLNHPHVVGVLDTGEDAGSAFIVLEYVEGETLKDRIRRLGRLPVPEAVAYAVEVARALGAAHAAGIVHRDVKPQNVLIDEEGSAKVTDFGIARTLDQEGLTQDGRVLGTTDYVAPEQALGHPVTGQSDLYSLGVVLFEMLTGEVPFRGENQIAVAMKHVREELPDVQVRRPEVSTSLATVVDRATAKDLGTRYVDDDAFVADLEDALTVEISRSGQATGEAETVLRTLPARTQRRVPGAVLHPGRLAAVLALVTAVVLVVLFAFRDNAERGTGSAAPRPSAGAGATGAAGAQRTSGVSFKQSAAQDYDPNGTPEREEHADAAGRVVDRNANTAWDTENYEGDALTRKGGVGISVDAEPSAAAVRIGVDTPTPGWSGAIYGATGSSRPDSLAGWTRLSEIPSASRANDIPLDGTRYRWFLVWIDRLPEDERSAAISEITLLQRLGGPSAS